MFPCIPRAYTLLVLWVAFLGGCENRRQTGTSSARGSTATAPKPLASPANLASPTLIGELRCGKDSLESWGKFAKKEIRRNAKGQELYRVAMSTHNGCVSSLAAGLDANIDEAALRTRLADGDIARTALVVWCEQHTPRRLRTRQRQMGEQTCSCQGGDFIKPAVDLLLGLLHEWLEYRIELKELDRKLLADQREADRKLLADRIERIKQELRLCECEQWDDL